MALHYQELESKGSEPCDLLVLCHSRGGSALTRDQEGCRAAPVSPGLSRALPIAIRLGIRMVREAQSAAPTRDERPTRICRDVSPRAMFRTAGSIIVTPAGVACSSMNGM